MASGRPVSGAVSIKVDPKYQAVMLSVLERIGARVVDRSATRWRVVPPTPVELLDAHLSAAAAMAGRPVARLTGDERQTAVEYLRQRGAFEVRGSVARTAHVMAVSPATIYAHLRRTPAG